MKNDICKMPWTDGITTPFFVLLARQLKLFSLKVKSFFFLCEAYSLRYMEKIFLGAVIHRISHMRIRQFNRIKLLVMKSRKKSFNCISIRFSIQLLSKSPSSDLVLPTDQI